MDRLYRDLIAGFAKHKTRIYHFERSGPKSYWGGFFPKDATRGDPNAWQGKNMLGKLLMEEGKRLLKNARTRRAKTVRARKTAPRTDASAALARRHATRRVIRKLDGMRGRRR